MDMTDSAVRKAETFEGLESALRVLKIESEALVALAESLDGRFLEALDLLFNATGRVIVTGMGKAGMSAVKSPPPWHRPERPPTSSIRARPAMAIWA